MHGAVMRRALGACLLVLPLAGLFTFEALTVGPLWALAAFVLAAATLGAVVLGVRLLVDGA